MESLPKHPRAGLITGQYFVSEDGSVKVPATVLAPEVYQELRRDLATYQWNNSDFLLASYPKNGTHFMWEVMTMLQRGSADYVQYSKNVLMIDMSPINQINKVFPSPRVLNSHYRTDVLPAEFRKGKTVIVMRNPKDACVSYYYHEVKILPKAKPHYKELGNLTFGEYITSYMYNKNKPFGNYFDYTEYMWTLRDDSNHLLVFYEDLKLEPVATIQKINEFMGTKASPELVQKIADATSFDKMKKAKQELKMSEALKNAFTEHKTFREDSSAKLKEATKTIYRKGGIGDWKNHFTAVDNEMFDEFLASWEGGKGIPFKY